MGITDNWSYAIVALAGAILCACCVHHNNTGDCHHQSVSAGNGGPVGLSARYVYLHPGPDTSVVTVQYSGWLIDSIRIYEDVSGSRLLDKTFCFSKKHKKLMHHGRPIEQRYGWLKIKTDKNVIIFITTDTRLTINERHAMLYLHQGTYRDSIRVEHGNHRFMAEKATSTGGLGGHRGKKTIHKITKPQLKVLKYT